MTKKRKFEDEREKLADTFAGVFHSFKDLNKVRPIDFLKKLEKAGVILTVVGTRGVTKP